MKRLIIIGRSGAGKTYFVKKYITTHPHLRFKVLNDHHHEYYNTRGKYPYNREFENLVLEDEEADITVYEWGDSPAPKIKQLENTILIASEFTSFKRLGLPIDELVDDSCIVIVPPIGYPYIMEFDYFGIHIEPKNAPYNYYLVICTSDNCDDEPIKQIGNVLRVTLISPGGVTFKLGDKEVRAYSNWPFVMYTLYFAKREHARELAGLL